MERALIVSNSVRNTDTMQRLLDINGFFKLTKASSGSHARRIISDSEFELVIIDSPLPDEFGHELAITISEVTAAGIILICRNDIAADMGERVSDSGICVISKPFAADAFLRLLKKIRDTRARMLGSKKENVSLLTKIEEMRLINRAKCTLMQYLKFTEPQAHRYIEKQAMNNRQTRKEVALKVLAAYER
ncbi:MAG: ANTAR domain-containing protein [Oscillospiraceae bacterium]|nr:ANTAR domain-containing protein [Oscillospiraceae bacterium]